MAGVNKVILIGNLGKDPEMKTLEGGNKICKFSIATTETYKDKGGEKRQNTEWHNIICWNKLAEIAEKYLKKGSQIYVEGKIKTRSWDDKDNKKCYMTEIIAESFTMLGKKNDIEEAPNNQQTSKLGEADDLPF